MTHELDELAAQVGEGKNLSHPPLHLWHPELSGDIDIVIRSDGSWWHEGDQIKRAPLVNLFASILRREDDGDYYLLTPVEKWRIKVDFLPLLIVDFDLQHAGSDQQVLSVVTNTGRDYVVGPQFPLFIPAQASVPGATPDLAGIPAVQLDYGLAALLGRPVWYRLMEGFEAYGVETKEGFSLLSSGEHYILG
mgnify:CR=1 FL=1